MSFSLVVDDRSAERMNHSLLATNCNLFLWCYVALCFVCGLESSVFWSGVGEKKTICGIVFFFFFLQHYNLRSSFFSSYKTADLMLLILNQFGRHGWGKRVGNGFYSKTPPVGWQRTRQLSKIYQTRTSLKQRCLKLKLRCNFFFPSLNSWTSLISSSAFTSTAEIIGIFFFF